MRRCRWHPCGMRPVAQVVIRWYRSFLAQPPAMGWQPFGLMPGPGTTFNHTPPQRSRPLAAVRSTPLLSVFAPITPAAARARVHGRRLLLDLPEAVIHELDHHPVSRGGQRQSVGVQNHHLAFEFPCHHGALGRNRAPYV